LATLILRVGLSSSRGIKRALDDPNLFFARYLDIGGRYLDTEGGWLFSSSYLFVDANKKAPASPGFLPGPTEAMPTPQAVTSP
jgi:hypothetical protein